MGGGMKICGVKAAAVFVIMAVAFGYPWQAGEAAGFSRGGYFKNYSVALHQPEIDNLPGYDDRAIIGAVSNRLRLEASGKPAGWLSVSAAYDLCPRIQDRSLFDESSMIIVPVTQPYRALDFDYYLYPDDETDIESFAVHHNLDRLFFTVQTEWSDISVGRQAVAWGSARVINPTDVFVPYAFNDLDVEDRIGVDAVRMRVPVGMMSEIDAGFVFGDEFMSANSAVFVRGRHYILRTDVALTLVGFRKHLLVGLDLARAVGGAGLWLEAAHVFVDALNSPDGTRGENYFRSSIGCDYSLRDGTYLFIEYHYNQAGTDDPADYLGRLREPAYGDGAVYLLGQHYLAPGLVYQLTPLMTITGEAVVNIADPSVFITPSIEYNLIEDMYISAGAYIGWGKGPVSEYPYAPGPHIRLRSEFGGYPGLIFASLRVYF